MSIKSSIAAASVVVLLSGCQTGVPDKMAATQQPPSKALRLKIVAAARDWLVDPYSVRDAEISNVVTLNQTSGLKAVCVKANAKNRMGGYTGRQAVSVRILNDNLVGTLQNAQGCYDPKIHYQPFPELERT